MNPDETKTAKEVEMLIDARRKIALEIIGRFSPDKDAPLPSEEFNALREFTKGWNAGARKIVDLAWEIGVRKEVI